MSRTSWSRNCCAPGGVAFMVVEKGDITGLVTPHEIKQVDRAKWPFMTLHDIMRPLEDLRAVGTGCDPDKRA